MPTFFKHWKSQLIYKKVAEAYPVKDEVNFTDKTLVANHHETAEPMTFKLGDDGIFYSPNHEAYVIYIKESDALPWAREKEEFYGYKTHEDGSEIQRFEPVSEDELKTIELPYEKEDVDIKVPEDYVQQLNRTIDSYDNWLKKNKKLQWKADQAETDKEREEYLKQMTQEFKARYAGIVAKDQGDRLSRTQLLHIWERFMKQEYRGFLKAHVNLNMQSILQVGFDKFVYVMGWQHPSDVAKWKNNKVRVGICCHCQDQFIPMILQTNHGLCQNCRPLYSTEAIRKFILHQLDTSKRYEYAKHDALMDFHIMFYHDHKFRKFFLKGSNAAEQIEALSGETPEWLEKEMKAAGKDPNQ